MSTPYGMPPTPKAGVPATPPPKSRTPLFIGLACGCVLLLVLVVGAVGVGLFLIGKDAEEGPAPTSTTSPSDPGPSDSPSDSPSEDPTTELDPDQPVDKPTEGPETEAASSSAGTFTITHSAPEEGATLTTSDGEKIESEKGKFVGLEITIENKASRAIGFETPNFRFYDADGKELSIRYGYYQTPSAAREIPPGETATGQLYADVPADAVLAEVSYTDEVGTGGEEFRMPVGG